MIPCAQKMCPLLLMTFPKPQMVTWQIVSGLGQAHSFRGGSSYPFPFNYFVNIIEVFMLDFFAFFNTDCVRSITYAEKLAVAFLTVVSLGVVSVGIGACTSMEEDGGILRSSFFKGYIVLIYVMLPVMSSMAFSAFNCDEVSQIEAWAWAWA